MRRDSSRSFPSHPLSAAAVREFVREACNDVLPAEDLDAAILLTSELVANAVLHADGEHLEVRVLVTPTDTRIGVRDDDPASPQPSAPAEGNTSGRGLQLMDRLAANWGVSYSESGGKWVWFSLHPPPHSGPVA